jgi:phospholipase C
LPPFRHVLVVVFENHERDQVLGSRDAPTFNALARRYATLSRYHGVAHPSLPNYLALVSGSTQGITDDCTSCTMSGPSLADSLEKAGRTWKTYAEGLARPGFAGPASYRYAKKHDPLMYWPSIAGDPRRAARIVPFPELATDAAGNRLPDFALVVPDMCNSMHDCSVATGDAWLRTQIAPLLAKPALARSVVFVIFDEGSSDRSGGGEIAAFAAGPAVRAHARYEQPLSHYGLLRTIEDAWGLPRLGESAREQPITGIWR